MLISTSMDIVGNDNNKGLALKDRCKLVFYCMHVKRVLQINMKKWMILGNIALITFIMLVSGLYLISIVMTTSGSRTPDKRGNKSFSAFILFWLKDLYQSPEREYLPLDAEVTSTLICMTVRLKGKSISPQKF